MFGLSQSAQATIGFIGALGCLFDLLVLGVASIREEKSTVMCVLALVGAVISAAGVIFFSYMICDVKGW